MIALISCRDIVNNYGINCSQLENRYVDFFSSIGYTVLLVPNVDQIINITEMNIDLIVLSGGGGIPNSFYTDCRGGGEQPNRDLVEGKLIEYGITNNIPIIGICRGAQFLNGYFNGRVSHFSTNKHGPGIDHYVELNKCSSKLLVNSYHNDYIKIEELSSLFTVIGTSEDGCVEAYMSELPHILGIQWHPERFNSNERGRLASIKLITNFLNIRS